MMYYQSTSFSDAVDTSHLLTIIAIHRDYMLRHTCCVITAGQSSTVSGDLCRQQDADTDWKCFDGRDRDNGLRRPKVCVLVMTSSMRGLMFVCRR
jgi:hypothetical protein